MTGSSLSLLSNQKCVELNPQEVSAGQALSDIYRQTGNLEVNIKMNPQEVSAGQVLSDIYRQTEKLEVNIEMNPQEVSGGQALGDIYRKPRVKKYQEEQKD